MEIVSSAKVVRGEVPDAFLFDLYGSGSGYGDGDSYGYGYGYGSGYGYGYGYGYGDGYGYSDSYGSGSGYGYGYGYGSGSGYGYGYGYGSGSGYGYGYGYGYGDGYGARLRPRLRRRLRKNIGWPPSMFSHRSGQPIYGSGSLCFRRGSDDRLLAIGRKRLARRMAARRSSPPRPASFTPRLVRSICALPARCTPRCCRRNGRASAGGSWR